MIDPTVSQSLRITFNLNVLEQLNELLKHLIVTVLQPELLSNHLHLSPVILDHVSSKLQENLVCWEARLNINIILHRPRQIIQHCCQFIMRKLIEILIFNP